VLRKWFRLGLKEERRLGVVPADNGFVCAYSTKLKAVENLLQIIGVDFGLYTDLTERTF
jgi:hypothetical protein